MAVLSGSAAKRSAWARWLGNCSSGRRANPTFYGKTIGGWPDVAVDALRALEMALKATGYKATSRWAYNFRQITGSKYPCRCSDARGCSLHSYPLAVDIDPAQNPYSRAAFSWSRTKFTPTQVAAVEAIRNTKGERIWEWGGRWSSVRDYMHWELRVTPDSCKVNWSTVKGYKPAPKPAPTPTPTEGEIEVKRGMKGRAVAEIQHAGARFWGWKNGSWKPMGGSSYYSGRAFGPGEDGAFGATTETNVKSFQKAMGLPETGVVDGVTLTLLLGKY